MRSFYILVLHWTGPVSGHDFSRADDNSWNQGLQPLRRGLKPRGLKPALQIRYEGRATSERNSSRVALLERNAPSMVLVMAPECCFSTPRIIMQK